MNTGYHATFSTTNDFENKKKTLKTKVKSFVYMDLELNYNDREILVDKIIAKCLENNNTTEKYIKSYLEHIKNIDDNNY